MSDYQHKDMTGTIFKNTFKKEGEKTPDYKGKINVRGELLEIALWVTDGAKGKFFSAKIQEPRGSPVKTAAPKGPPDFVRTARRSSADMDSDDWLR